MFSTHIATQIYGKICFETTPGQKKIIEKLSEYLAADDFSRIFVLNGYAGTGKTTLIAALVGALKEEGIKPVLLAPTGRAAKVLARYAGEKALTIHKRIYRERTNADYESKFTLNPNPERGAVFIVDEASMLSDTTSGGAVFGSGSLLSDLVDYVRSGRGCRLILVGDSAQLPPVGLEQSPALDARVLSGYGLQVMPFTLHKVARQRDDSGVLENATLLRMAIEAYCRGEVTDLDPPVLRLRGYDDIRSISSEYLIDELGSSYDRLGVRGTTLITRSNKRAAHFNLGIRNSIFYYEEELVAGDLLMVAKNNYLWSEQYEGLDFIANGEMARVVRVRGMEEARYGLRFATLELELPDHDVEVEAKAVLDALYSEAAALTREQSEMLYVSAMSQLVGDKRTRYRALKRNPYFNALQVKYGYAVTCHKAQGGQWEDVYIDMGGIPEEAFTTLQFYRWLYTAITRARTRVFLINSPLPTE